MNENNPIGGYIELSLNQGEEYHRGALALNSGRSALEFILNQKKPTRVWIPNYICDSVIETINKLGLPYSEYILNEDFLPDNLAPESHDWVLYVNYYGLCDSQTKHMMANYNTILDNTHAFFSPLGHEGNSFNSARKFFGVPDGGYTGTNPEEEYLTLPIHEPKNYDYLIQRLLGKTEEGYSSFLENEKDLSNTGVKRMSTLSKKILQNIDYNSVAESRRSNYHYLLKALGERNQIQNVLSLNEKSVPFTFPLLLKNGCEIKKKLIEKKIFVPTLWNGIFEKEGNSFVGNLAKNTLFLPIDQRYNHKHMDRIINEISEL